MIRVIFACMLATCVHGMEVKAQKEVAVEIAPTGRTSQRAPAAAPVSAQPPQQRKKYCGTEHPIDHACFSVLSLALIAFSTSLWLTRQPCPTSSTSTCLAEGMALDNNVCMDLSYKCDEQTYQYRDLQPFNQTTRSYTAIKKELEQEMHATCAVHELCIQPSFATNCSSLYHVIQKKTAKNKSTQHTRKRLAKISRRHVDKGR